MKKLLKICINFYLFFFKFDSFLSFFYKMSQFFNENYFNNLNDDEIDAVFGLLMLSDDVLNIAFIQDDSMNDDDPNIPCWRVLNAG